jgi:hypothetical protein
MLGIGDALGQQQSNTDWASLLLGGPNAVAVVGSIAQATNVNYFYTVELYCTGKEPRCGYRFRCYCEDAS